MTNHREEYEKKRREKILSVLKKMTMDELYLAIGRYAGPRNTIICEKKYGVTFTEADINEELAERFLTGE